MISRLDCSIAPGTIPQILIVVAALSPPSPPSPPPPLLRVLRRCVRLCIGDLGVVKLPRCARRIGRCMEVCGRLAAGDRSVQTLGGKPKSLGPLLALSWGYPPPGERMLQSSPRRYGVRCCALQRTALWGTQWGQMDDPLRGFSRLRCRRFWRLLSGRIGCPVHPDLVSESGSLRAHSGVPLGVPFGAPTGAASAG